MITTRLLPLLVLSAPVFWTTAAVAQEGRPDPRPTPEEQFPFPPDFGPPGFGPGGGPGGPGGGPGGGPMGQETKVLTQFDADHNGRLDAEERKTARAWLAENRPQRGGRGPGGMGRPGGGPGGFPGGGPGGPPGMERGRTIDPNAKGKTVTPADVPSYPDRGLFDPDIVRTIFVEFPAGDWFAELSDFYRTDVAVPATVTVDGKTYPNVGTGFRGNTSYMMVQGKKKSWDFDFAFVDSKQHLLGARNLDLINCNADASFLREVIHGWIANQFFPSPRVALVRLVVNGEDFGMFAGVQQFDKEYVQDHYGTKQGDRWKVPPDFSGGGGLRYLGDDPAAYKRSYQIKSKDNEAAWQALVDLCAVLEKTPIEDLERILPQHLDVEATLWFLAIDNALGDDDGYFSRASDYLLYRDPKGRFHPIPRDNNEILLPEQGGGGGRRPGGQRPGGQGPGGQGPGGMRRGPGGPGGPGGGVATSPLQGASRQDRPLLHCLLEVPAWRERYLADLRQLATTVMTDEVLGKRLATWQTMIAPIVEGDVHSLYGYEAFQNSFAKDEAGKPAERSILAVVAQRRKAILDDPALRGEWPAISDFASKAQLSSNGHFTLYLQCRVGGAKVREVRLHHDHGTFGSYDTAVMFDDGQHGDGEAHDGLYAAELPAVEAGQQWRFWIEAVAADSGHVDCLPAGGGAQPITWLAPKKAGK
jgi:hypothetical protein